MSTVLFIRNNLKTELNFTGEHLLSELIELSGLSFSQPCGGQGKCRKCRVKLIDSTGERFCLACRETVASDCTVILDTVSEHSAVTETYSVFTSHLSRGEGFGAALDLGTTTLALRLFSLSTGEQLSTVSAGSAQSIFGADVISRMKYAIAHPDGTQKMSDAIVSQLERMLCDAAAKAGISRDEIKLLTLAGNTTMQHLFCALSPEGMASAPFTPLSLFDDGEYFTSPILGSLHVLPTPCISAFIGGDILAGLYACGMAESDELTLFLDIGTNGEMALGNRDGIVCCSVASGPAFEGAEISCGMAGTTGAISRVSCEDRELHFETIGNAAPKGICGSGLIELLSVLLRLCAVDEGGRLLPPDELEDELPFITEDENGNGLCVLDEENGITLSAADIRALQLAKAAVAAGIRVLLKERGVSMEQIDRLVLAGGFGSRLSKSAAADIGLIPRELIGKTQVLGNCSLAGAQAMLLDDSVYNKLLELRKLCRVEELSANPDFSDEFIDQMLFDDFSEI